MSNTIFGNIIKRRIGEEQEGLAEAEACLAEQRGRVALLEEIAGELDAIPDHIVTPEQLLANMRGKIVTADTLPETASAQSASIAAMTGGRASPSFLDEFPPSAMQVGRLYTPAGVEIALELYEELLRRFNDATTDRHVTVSEWASANGGVQALRKWAMESVNYFAGILHNVIPADARDMLVWDYEVIPAIIDRIDFRMPEPVTPHPKEIEQLIERMVKDQLEALRVKAGHDA